MFHSLRDKLRRLQIAQRAHSAPYKTSGIIPQEAALRLFLTAYRQKLKQGAVSGPAIQKTAVGKSRFAKKKSRQILKSFRRDKRFSFSKPLLLQRYSENKLAAGLVSDRKSRWVPILRRRPHHRYQQLVLHDFSFIDHPQRTLDLILQVLDFEANAIDAQLHFDDEYCVDVSAYLTLAEMWPQMAKVFRGGRMNIPIQKVVETLNLRKDLAMKLPGLNNVDDIWAFPRRTRRAANTSRSEERHLDPQSREKVADEFCNAVDAWLSTAADELELTVAGKARFANIIGELLDNAERHSNPPGTDGGWSTAAFMARRFEGDAEVFRCHMGFLSVGASIAESLKTASIDIRAQINKYTDRHRDCGISADTLITLVGLQDGITRDRAAAAKERGGLGLQEVLELISVLGVTTQADKGPRMTIVSGRSCIQARIPYLMGKRTGEYEPRMLWFNPDNSPEQPPDSNFVFDLSSRFPGTIIGLTFVLSKQDLMAVLDATDRA